MRIRSFVVAALVVSTFAFSPSPARAAGQRAGEIIADVTVHRSPSETAATVTDLAAGAPVVGHEKRNGWIRITGSARGWIPAEAFGIIGNEAEQQRRLLSELATANGKAEVDGQTEADLMYDALKQWRGGETPDSATIDRVLARSKKEVERTRREVREKVKQLFWKDPFSDQPKKLILVRKEDRDRVATARMTGRSRRGSEASEPEIARLRSELAVARAEAERAKAELARLVSKYETLAARGETRKKFAVEDESDDDSEGTGETVTRRARRSNNRRSSEQLQAFNSQPSAPRGERKRSSSLGAWQAAVDKGRPGESKIVEAAAPVHADTVTTMPPEAWKSNSGIIVVPIDSPIPIRVDGKSKRAR